MKILFMGTSEFAVASLKALLETGHELCGVVTQPDQPKGRGYVMTPTPVKAFAQSLSLPVFTPASLRDGSFLSVLERFAPELVVVVAYGKILPASVLSVPPLGCVNVHGSLLPKYRGAAPIHHALLAGEEKTGVTTMYMDEGLDTGDMIFQAETVIALDDNFGTLHDRLAQLGGELLVKTVDCIAAKNAPRIPQTGPSCYAGMVDRQLRRIHFSETTGQTFGRIRAFSPAPGAYCLLGDKMIKVLASRPEEGSFTGEPGTVLDEKHLIVRTGDGALRLTMVQPEGKKPMSGESFCAGYRPKRLV